MGEIVYREQQMKGHLNRGDLSLVAEAPELDLESRPDDGC
jgi:hypothetical protein